MEAKGRACTVEPGMKRPEAIILRREALGKCPNRMGEPKGPP